MENKSDSKEVIEVARTASPKRYVPCRILFVIPFLAFHALMTVLFLPSFGSSPGADIFEVYFVFTSFPANLVGAFSPQVVNQSSFFVVCLAVNSVLVAWGFACGLRFFLYKE